VRRRKPRPCGVRMIFLLPFYCVGIDCRVWMVRDTSEVLKTSEVSRTIHTRQSIYGLKFKQIIILHL
jgi:hypothetical protein